MRSSLSDLFESVAVKRLSEVEVVQKKSNQHEFNGTRPVRKILGDDKAKFEGKFIYVNDTDDVLEVTGNLTWYDSRLRVEDRSAEYRLYYTSNDVINKANAGDVVIIAKEAANSLVIIVAQNGSTAEKQLLWLFGLDEVGNNFLFKDTSQEKTQLGFAAKYIIESLGFEIEEEEPDYLSIILEKYGGAFPSTAEFSAFARGTLKDINPISDPDTAILQWLQREEALFRTLEKHIVQQKLKAGFGTDGLDVDDFIRYSLSVQNRRKSRAGLGFENHLEVIFQAHKLMFSKKAKTERNNTPDFLFPGIKQYKNSAFDTGLLSMLGLKTSAKERWTQVLSEADRIAQKHFMTLEPAISKNQTDEMVARRVQLVLPNDIISSYSSEQRKHIMSLGEFIEFVTFKQKHL